MRKPLFILLFALTFLSTYCSNNSSRALEQKGMALGLFSKDPNYSYLKDLQEMKEWGIQNVLLIVSWYQRDIKSTQIIPRTYDGNDIMTLPDAKLREVIGQAHSLGLKTVVFPILRLEIRNEKDWRGVIAPTDLNTWWTSYEKFILHYAALSAAEKVAFFSVGSELLSMEEQKNRWDDLIAKVKKIYSGKLLYSANWDHYHVPQFWDSLDFIGITAYHEIAKDKNPTLKELKTGWRKIKEDLLAWKKKYPKQRLIFTEIGYPSIDGGAQYPWNYFLEGPVDLQEQALAYRAFIETWRRSKELAGVYFWVWWGEGGEKDNSYTPRNKPAGNYIQRWYKS